MRALTVVPEQRGSLRAGTVPEPHPAPGEPLVRDLALGVRGTDKEIARGEYGWAPPGRDRLVLGHESLGQVITPAAGFAEGDLVVGVVQRPGPVPCGACAAGKFDMCRNGRDTDGPKPRLVEALGATHHHDPVEKVLPSLEPDIVLEAGALGRADLDWPGGPVTRRVPLARTADAFETNDDDVKVVIDLDGER
jgi:threonine dehydrogenase-like Zn-dependent dehydrogenase